MDKNGGDSASVKFIEVASGALAGAFEAGRIDAAITGEPFMALLKPVTRILSYALDAISPSFTIAAYVTTTAWARAHRDKVRRFQDAMRASATWANQNHDASADILAQASHINPAVVRSMTRIPFPDRLTAAMIQPVIDVTARYGGGAAFSADELIFRA
jgi:NitT/TauT family transport system substrate-binding protein